MQFYQCLRITLKWFKSLMYLWKVSKLIEIKQQLFETLCIPQYVIRHRYETTMGSIQVVYLPVTGFPYRHTVHRSAVINTIHHIKQIYQQYVENFSSSQFSLLEQVHSLKSIQGGGSDISINIYFPNTSLQASEISKFIFHPNLIFKIEY